MLHKLTGVNMTDLSSVKTVEEKSYAIIRVFYVRLPMIFISSHQDVDEGALKKPYSNFIPKDY